MQRTTVVGGALTPPILEKVDAGKISIELDDNLEPEYAEQLDGKSSDELIAIIAERIGKESEYKWLMVERRVDDDSDRVVLTSRKARGKSSQAVAINRLMSAATLIESMAPVTGEAREKAMEKLVNASCSSCQANNVMREYFSKVVTRIKSGGHSLDMDELRSVLNHTDFSYLSALYSGSATPSPAPVSLLTRERRNEKIAIPPTYGGPRPTCLDCCRKHLGKAISQLGEAELGYPHHFWLAMANLSEMEEESLAEHPSFAAMVREIRIEMSENKEYKPNLMELFDMIDELEGSPSANVEIL